MVTIATRPGVLAQRHVVLRCMLSLTVLACVGCGSDQLPVYPVRGQVVFEGGQPVRHGKVELESVEHGTTATGTIDHSGKFQLGTYSADDGAVAGKHKGIVVQMVIADGSFQHTTDHGQPVPVRYADYHTSPLEFTVAPDQDNQLTITIQGDR